MALMAEHKQRTDFADLVRRRRAELGISLRELEARAVDPESGEQAKFGWISKLEQGKPVTPPSEGLLKALAIGLALPLQTLQEAAAAQFFGLVTEVWSKDHTTRVLVARIGEMNDGARRQFANIAETFARDRAQSDGTTPD